MIIDKEYLLNKILYPILAILFCLAFGVPFTFHGFQTVNVQGERTDNGSVMLDITRTHFAGLFMKQIHLESVESAHWHNTRIRRIGKTRKSVSGVVIESTDNSVSLFAGSSDLDEKTKWKAINQINTFINSPEQDALSETYIIRNAFGWFGLPFLVLGLGGVVSWPFSLFSKDDSFD
jgi:hypothetical protein